MNAFAIVLNGLSIVCTIALVWLCEVRVRTARAMGVRLGINLSQASIMTALYDARDAGVTLEEWLTAQRSVLIERDAEQSR